METPLPSARFRIIGLGTQGQLGLPRKYHGGLNHTNVLSYGPGLEICELVPTAATLAVSPV